jgi:hypothetical protein
MSRAHPKPLHVIPVDDLVEHDTDDIGQDEKHDWIPNLSCICGPRVEYEDPEFGEWYDAPLIIHEALDGRE